MTGHDQPSIFSLTRPLQHVRATDLTTKREVLDVFASQRSAQAITVAVTVLVAARVGLGEPDRGDVIAAVVTIALVGIVEWVVHRHVLHGSPATRYGQRLGLAAGHRKHHERPAELRWLLMSGSESVLALVGAGVFTAAWSAPLAVVAGTPIVATFLTAWSCAALGLLHYEWVHLLVHTRYRPRTRHYARLARHHRLHHHRDEHAWLGITSLAGDRLLRTAPLAAGSTAHHRLGNS